MILKSVRKLSLLVTNILRLNKLENQEISIRSVSFDLSARLADSILSFADKCEEKGVGIEADVKDDVYITSDPDLLDMAWNNLIANAVKFTDRGGRISVSLMEEESEVKVVVSDTGCGISASAIGHIYDRFYQGDTSHKTEGNGLGLALVKRILEMTEGQIEVESQEGKGSSFTITLPKNS